MSKRKKSPWFAFYVDDFISGTISMSMSARGAFVSLLAYQFSNGSIPPDDRTICRIIGAFPDEWDAVKGEILPKFDKDENGNLVNSRMDKERAEREGIRQKRIDAAKAGVEARRNHMVQQNGTQNGSFDQSKDPGLLKASSSSSSSTLSSDKSEDISYQTFLNGRICGVGISDQLLQILEAVEGDDAKSFHDAAELALTNAGFEVAREFPVPDRGDGRRGFVDLCIVGLDAGNFGIELDNRTPRQKSLHKLKANFNWWAVVCRPEQKKSWNPDSIQKRINLLFRRKDSTRWNAKELKAYRGIDFEQEDLDLIEQYYTASIESHKDFRRRDIGTLLNNWTGEVDRARAYCEQPRQMEAFNDGRF